MAEEKIEFIQKTKYYPLRDYASKHNLTLKAVNELISQEELKAVIVEGETNIVTQEWSALIGPDTFMLLNFKAINLLPFKSK